MSQIYTAFYDISQVRGSQIPNYVNHLYLVKDSDGNLATTNDQSIIRGQAEFNPGFNIVWDVLFGTTNAGHLQIRTGSSSVVIDGLDYDADTPPDGILDTDRNNDGNPDTVTDRGYTLVGLNGQDADTVWTALVTYATHLDAAGYDYDLLSANCVSVAASALASVGVDITQFFPYQSILDDLDFIGETNILDTNSADSFTLFANSNGIYTFLDRPGADTIVVESGARLEIVKDAAAGSTNKVVMLDVGARNLALDAQGGDLQVQFGTAELVVLGDQYGANGLAADTLELRGDGSALIKTLDLSLIPEEDVSAPESLFTYYTALASQPDVAGNATNDHLYGDGAANILAGGRGDDVIRGGAGTDTYEWSLGDGSDTIYDDWAENDTVDLGPGITRGMVDVAVSGSDLVLSVQAPVAGYAGSITVRDAASLQAAFLADHVEGIVYESSPATSTYLWGTYNPETGEYEDQNDTVTGSDTLEAWMIAGIRSAGPEFLNSRCG